MARYTIELRKLIERNYPIFDDSWNTFDPAHKKELENKIIRHYWFQEIGAETPDRFRHYINEQLALEMPFYNQRYASETLKIEPLLTTYLETQNDQISKKNLNRITAAKTDIDRARSIADSMKDIISRTENLTGNKDVAGSLDKIVNGKHDETWTETHKETQSTDSTVDTTNDKLIGETVEGEKHDTSSGTRNTTHTKYYSDTPQKALTQTGVGIRSDYLTNWQNDLENETTSGTADESIKNETNRTEKETGKEVTDSDSTKDLQIDGSKNFTENETTEQGTSEKTNETQDTTEDTTEKRFSNGSENEKTARVDGTTSNEEENTKTGTTVTHKGFNISQSELLLKYRDTFINVDNEIIQALAVNFMGIF